MKHPDSTHHCYDLTYQIKSLKKDVSHRLMAGTPLAALAELHNLAQNTHHWGPDDYVVTYLKRDGFAPYELPATRNPDVRRRPRGSNAGAPTVEMFPLDELRAPQKPDTPICVLPVDAPAASMPSPQ